MLRWDSQNGFIPTAFANFVFALMIRKFRLHARLPGHLRDLTRKTYSEDFKEILLENPIGFVAKQIPYPVERQAHALIILGYGHVDMHTDYLIDYNKTSYCIPIHLPKDARLCQNDQLVKMEIGWCYSFNHEEMHGVDVPDGCRTYTALLIVDIKK